MAEPVSAIRNIGPRSEAGFARAGLHSAEEVRALGAEESYKRLVRAGTRPHFIGFYALWLGLQGRPWTDLQPEEKARLRTIFDRLVAEARAAEPIGDTKKGRTPLDAALSEIGVIEKPDQPTSSRPAKK
ncbi:TfoX/Sxy family DNA transformation protein [Oceanomicrobium pacificus]|uniref:Competence protein TfoX n=1 Tax=Oceanomicrobium pacificus TaxID=2692916 RepID=A0A6B0TMD3_9RHOB|nr:TfoX/Sxy family DNA transformation protein [Oceanomicrobium pacificus]MXU65720.1 competence protein TfoX [Oceanomicrobium pacificus]